MRDAGARKLDAVRNTSRTHWTECPHGGSYEQTQWWTVVTLTKRNVLVSSRIIVLGHNVIGSTTHHIFHKSMTWAPRWPKLDQVGNISLHLGAMFDHFGAMFDHLATILYAFWAILAPRYPKHRNKRTPSLIKRRGSFLQAVCEYLASTAAACYCLRLSLSCCCLLTAGCWLAAAEM